MALVVVGFFALVAMPATLMAIAHFFAVFHQDKRAWYIVLLNPRVKSFDLVVNDQASRFHMTVAQRWDTPATKGYSAYIPLKRLDALRNDRRVSAVFRRDEEDD